MRNEINLSENFRDKSVDGFAEFYDGALKAQDNPDFMNSYKDLLAQNDRVLYLDNHIESDGKEFMASDQHMSALADAGYEFQLIEHDPILNSIVESYERGEMEIDDVRKAITDFQFKCDQENPDYEEAISSGRFAEKDIFEYAKTYVAPFVDAIENAKEHGIKVRFFDDVSVIGQDLDEKDENAHIDNPLFRRDDTWDPYIEALTKGAKASVFIGGSHAATSYGIDEYMEAHGYKVGTFRISPEVGADGISAEKNDIVEIFEGQLARDPDGFDRSDFVVDLFYHDTTKTIEWQKMMAQDAEFREMENGIAPAVVDPELESEVIQIIGPEFEPAEEVISLSSSTSFKL